MSRDRFESVKKINTRDEANCNLSYLKKRLPYGFLVVSRILFHIYSLL